MRRRDKDEVEGSRGFEGDTHVITFHVYVIVHVTEGGICGGYTRGPGRAGEVDYEMC